jgi:hypothetical protein
METLWLTIGVQQALLPGVIYIVLRSVLEHSPSSRVHATLEKVKASGLKRLLLVLTGTAVVALSRSFVRFPVTALGVSSTIFKACALLLLESALSCTHDEREHVSNGSNGLLQKPGLDPRKAEEEDVRLVRDLAGVVAIMSFLLCISFENLRRFDMIYRPQEGPVPSSNGQLPPVKTIYYNWDVGADVVGVLSETARAFVMLLMVSVDPPNFRSTFSRVLFELNAADSTISLRMLEHSIACQS